MLIGLVLLGIVYGYSYQTGIVQSFTAAIGAKNPGPLTAPSGLHNASLSDPTGGTGTGATATATEALSTLGGLRVAGKAPMTGYDRAQFGPAWTDVDHNGCDTRNDILARDLTAVTFTVDGGVCVVAAGTLTDPYTATTIAFTRGQSTSGAVAIDHVVALGDAWQTGAQALSLEQRTALANDPRNLLAVDGPTNSAKGDSDAATWLPPNKAFRCAYVTKQVAVKAAYHLWVTAAEKDSITTILKGC